MDITAKIDFREFEAALARLKKMGDVRKRDISKVFRDASKPIVNSAKKYAGRSAEGVVFSKYKSRIHQKGNLKKSIKFRTSKKFRLVYYVTPTAWYSQIVAAGHTAGEIPKGKAAYMGGIGWRRGKYKSTDPNYFMRDAINNNMQTSISNQM